MRWLIIEDSLESRKGHWFEYLEDFHRELPGLGDEVTLLVSWRAEPFIQTQLGALPQLPESSFLKLSDGSPFWRRYARIPVHAWKTLWAVRKYLRSAREPDVIFVPTVIVHNLLAWVVLIKLKLKRGNARVLLFFPGLPICKTGEATALDGSPTSKLTGKLLRWLAPEIGAGKVILGVETQAMKQAGEEVLGVPFTYFPHPVQPIETPPAATGWITMACYGVARSEKGSDVFALAMEKYLARFPDSRIRFVIQWLDNFTNASGGVADLPATLRNHPRVKIIRRLLGDGEYAQHLQAAQVLVLPYRCSSYALRVSRVVIEAMVNGLPVIVTKGTTLATQAEDFGTGLTCEDGDPDSLAEAIAEMESRFDEMRKRALNARAMAAELFSVREFRHIIQASAITSPVVKSVGAATGACVMKPLISDEP